ncbi:cell division protein FtsQ/DivIB [Pseudodesulfovibrio piezophilus]|uniref:Polypeptide-transport-associated domain protein FtsQ-type n=1 Tax=Pseudodesulfovibrio piezophilus (strain DSM 21447 / JCM 15486 / C1TLV30) TaxID=1322246 RepID=M1WW00_PSEP2|nr:FtsQ-type POTRA domain-containing protein [Pseudodesulfovibrio piezophilus]CCH48838.1 Polypeptide-transport-associated domain protein FtsQ-type [Pseudodesulfovibrio piezophilus C1TLV30]
MSTLTMGKQNRLKIGSKSGNKLHKKKKQNRSLTGTGQILMRFIMTLLGLSLIATLGVGLLYGYRFITSTAYFNLKEIQVTGTSRLTYGDVLSQGNVNLGLNCLEMNVGEVENKLSRNPWIKNVTVRRQFPSTLRINVTEKIPMFWIRQGAGLYFADARGKVIAPMHPGETASLPILSVAESIDDGAEVLSGILKKIQNRQTPFTQDQTAWIKLTSAHEIEIYLDGHAGGQGLTVRLSMDRWELQLERLKIAWGDMMRRGEFKNAAIIAASGDKIWVKKRPSRG